MQILEVKKVLKAYVMIYLEVKYTKEIKYEKEKYNKQWTPQNSTIININTLWMIEISRHPRSTSNGKNYNFNIN